MNLHLSPSKNFRTSRLGAGLMALALFFNLAACAEEQRYLLVFETTSTMKNRLPAVDAEIKRLFTTAFGGNLKPGDSVGVWTFDEKPHMGQFPLMTWRQDSAMEMASNLTEFVHGRLYAGSASFAALQPTMDRVIAGSERLTVVLVCSGTAEIKWTPYNESINDAIHQARAERKKNHSPFVIVLRTQQGKYVGATVNFPPKPATFPPFPLLPRETATNPPPVAVKPPVKPPVIVPPLIIVGPKHTNPETNEIPRPAVLPVTSLVDNPVSNPVPVVVPPTSPPPVTPVPAEVVVHSEPPAKSNTIASNPPVVQVVTNPLPPPAVPKPASDTAPVPAPISTLTSTSMPAVTSKAAVPVIAPKLVAPAAAPVQDKATPVLIFIGGGFLVVAVALVVFLFARVRRKPQGSLITSSMQDDKHPPERK